MDLLTTRTMEVTKLAMDGLFERQKAITANTANIMTPNYQRKEVSFENQLKELVQQDDTKRDIKLKNSIQYNPTSLDALTPERKVFLQSNSYEKFAPQVVDDTYSGSAENGNNVDIEKEIMDMAKVGTQYTVLSNLEQRAFKGMLDVIKGSGQ